MSANIFLIMLAAHTTLSQYVIAYLNHIHWPHIGMQGWYNC